MPLHRSRQRGAARPLLFAVATCAGLMAPDARAEAAEFGGSAALTTDYVFRGISQTLGDPAVQAGARLAGDTGVYGAVWGSTVEFAGDTGASSEVDYVVGWNGRLTENWALDVNVTYYDYPSARADLSSPELIGTLTWHDNY